MEGWKGKNKHLFYYSVCISLCVACAIIAPQPGIIPRPTAVNVPSLNHWTAREIPVYRFIIHKVFLHIFPPVSL